MSPTQSNKQLLILLIRWCLSLWAQMGNIERETTPLFPIWTGTEIPTHSISFQNWLPETREFVLEDAISLDLLGTRVSEFLMTIIYGQEIWLSEYERTMLSENPGPVGFGALQILT